MFFLTALVAQAAVHFTAPLTVLVPQPLALVGVACLLLGLLMVIQPALAFDRARTAMDPFGTPKLLMTDGWFRLSRNPMYLGMVVVLLGVALVLRSATPFLIVPPFLWLVDRRFIRHEEATLACTFGQAYEGYRRKVRRWV